MALTKPQKTVLCIFAAPVAVWAAASLYFTIASVDASEDGVCERPPASKNLSPEENAYTAIKEFSDDIPVNTTPFYSDGKLLKAYLDGTTNRLALAEDVREFLAAESNTFATAERILSAKGIDIPSEEIISASAKICPLVRIANIGRFKATYEASQGDIAAGRKTLLDIYRIGRFLQTADSPIQEISELIGRHFCEAAIKTAANPLFAPAEDESWRAKLRELSIATTADLKDIAKATAMNDLAGYVHASINRCATNRTLLAANAIASGSDLRRCIKITFTL